MQNLSDEKLWEASHFGDIAHAGSRFPAQVRVADCPLCDSEQLAGDMVFLKRCFNSFFRSSLLEWPRRNSVSNLFLAGTATNLVVERAARYADVADFAVAVVEDFCANRDTTWHDFEITQILPVFGQIASSKGLR